MERDGSEEPAAMPVGFVGGNYPGNGDAKMGSILVQESQK